MPNTLTDQFQLVKTTTLDANFIQVLLGKTVNYNDGFCRELFRDGKHLTSLRSPRDTFSAHKGDTMLSVNMGIVTVTFTDKIPTRDGYYISYDATARLLVLDPRTFAVCYVQGIDPLQKTVDVVLAALKREVAEGKHDAMSAVYLRGIVENDTGPRKLTQTQVGLVEVTPIVEYGVAILDAQTMSPHADPKRIAELEEIQRVRTEQERLAREQEIALATQRHREAVERARMSSQDRLDQQQAVINRHRQDEALEIDQVQWGHDRFQLEEGQRRDAALKMQIERAQRKEAADSELLDDLRSQGYSSAAILQHHPDLRYLFEHRDLMTGQLLNGDELLQLSATAAAPTTSPSSSAPDALLAMHGITSEPRGGDLLYTISHFGVTVSRHALSEQELQWTQIPDQSFAYLVEVVATGPIDQELKPQDLIYQIDNIPAPEIAELGPYLTMQQQRGNPVRVTYLRHNDDGGMFSDVALITIPQAQA
jgi:hypothetical protein